MKAKTKNTRIGFRVFTGDRDNPYCPGLRECVVQFWTFEKFDAAKDFADAVKRDRYVDEYAAKAKQIADASSTRSTVYWTKAYPEAAAEVKWLTNRERPGEWFGASINSGEFNAASVEMLGYFMKLLKADGVYVRDCSPRQLLAALTKAGAIAVKYVDSASQFIEDGDFNLDAVLPLPPKAEHQDTSGTDAPWALTPEQEKQDVQAATESTPA